MQYRNLQSNNVFEFSFHPLFISYLNLKPCYPQASQKKQKVVSPNGRKKHMHTHTHTHTYTTKKTKNNNNKNKEAKVTLVKQLAKEY